jgi:hypothetical protein
MKPIQIRLQHPFAIFPSWRMVENPRGKGLNNLNETSESANVFAGIDPNAY